jgi:hypothetical protein
MGGQKKGEETHLRLLVPIHRVRAITALHPAHPVQLVVHMTLLVPVPMRVGVHGRWLDLDVRGQGSGDGRGLIRVLCAPAVCRGDKIELEPGPEEYQSPRR